MLIVGSSFNYNSIKDIENEAHPQILLYNLGMIEA